jgi:hypothetical protein
VNLISKNKILRSEDVRIFQLYNKYYLYSADTKLICSLKIINDHIYLKQLYTTLPFVEIRGRNQTILHIEENLPIKEQLPNIPPKIHTMTRILYLDWFYNHGVNIFAANFVDYTFFSGYPSIVKWDDYSIKYNQNIYLAMNIHNKKCYKY